MGKDDKKMDCVTCKENTPMNELYNNAESMTYSNKPICNTCAEILDSDMDSIRQDKS